jgi:aminoglycoside phosphotransferase
MMLSPSLNLSVETCLDPEEMRKLLETVLPEFAGGVRRIDDLRVVKARRNASQRRNPNPITLCYELDVRDCATNNITKRQFYGKVFREGASAQAAYSTNALHLAQLDMLLWAWPDDPGLPQLPQLLDPSATQVWWGESAQEVCTLRYVPENRATLQYLRKPDGRSKQQLFAKTFCDDRGAEVYRRFSYFWERAQHDVDAPLVAQPVTYCEATRSLWQAQAKGTPLLQANISTLAPSLASRLARVMGVLHSAPLALAGSSLRDTAHWMAEIRLRRDKIVRVAPDLRERLERVTGTLEQAAENLPPYQSTLIHGDFHPEQAWIDGERIVLFDFDEFSLGDPMEDLAEFITKIEPGGANSEFATELVVAYARSVPERFDHQRLQWHLALQQLLQASRAFVFQVPNWRGELEHRLARTEALCVSMVKHGAA